MTAWEGEKAIQMSPKERWDYYGQKLRSGEIDFSEFSRILNQKYEGDKAGGGADYEAPEGQVEEPVTGSGSGYEFGGHDYSGGRDDGDRGLSSHVEQPVSPGPGGGGYASTTHTSKAKGTSQISLLIDFMKDGKWHSTLEIAASPAYRLRNGAGVCRIAARMYDIGKAGYTVESRKISRTVWEYRLL